MAIEEIRVLDHGLVRLVDSMGSDLSIARNARVSYDAAWRAGEDEGSDAKLIKYLLMNNHNTPFESVEVSFEVRAPIFVFRQWHRHRTQSYNELSARYRPLPQEFYVPDAGKIGVQSTDNKQMRTDDQNVNADEIQRVIRGSNEDSFKEYEYLISLDCPREIARSVLPVGTYSHMFAKANLFNWMRFCKERQHEHAQYEIRVYADAIAMLLATVAPVAMRVFREKYSNEN